MSGSRDRSAAPPEPAPSGDPAVVRRPGGSPQGARRRRWPRRTALGILALLLLGRLALSLSLPGLVEELAQDYGLHCTWRSLDLSFLGGEFELWHMEFVPQDAGTAASDAASDPVEPPEHAPDAVLFVEYVRADLSMLDLLTGDLVIRRAEVDGVDLLLELDETGRPKLLQRFLPDAAEEQPAPPPRAARGDQPAGEQVASAGPPPTTPSLEPFFRLDALRLQHVNVQVRELGSETPVDLGVDVDLRLSDLAAPERTTRFDLAVRALPALDLLQVHGTGTSAPRALDARLSVKGRGLRPGVVADLLAPFGVLPAAERLDFGLSAQVQARPLEGSETGLTLSASLSEVALRADGAEAAALDRVSLEVASFDAGALDIDQVHVQGVRARAEARPGGLLRVAGVDLLMGAGGPASEAPEAAEPEPAGGPLVRWTRLGSFLLTEVDASFLDAATPGLPELRLQLPRLELTGLEPEGAPAALAGELALPGLVERVQLSGQLAPFASPQTYQLDVKASGVAPLVLRPYLHPLGIDPDDTPSTFEASLAAALDASDEGLVAGLELSEVSLEGAEDWLALERLALEDVELPAKADVLRVGSLDVRGGRLRALRSADDVLRLLGVVIHPPGSGPLVAEGTSLLEAAEAAEVGLEAVEEAVIEAEAAMAEVAQDGAAVAGSGGLRLELGPVSLTDFALEVEDERLGVLGIEGLALSTGPLQIGGEEESSAPLRIAATIPGVLRRAGIEGQVVSHPERVELGLDLLLEGLVADRFAPLLAEAGVTPELDDGRFGLRLDAALGLGQAPRLDARLSGLAFTDGEQQFLSLDELRIDGLLAGDDELRITRLAVVGPTLSASRDVDGALRVAGFRMALPPAAADAPPDDAPPDDATAAAGPSSQPAGPEVAAPSAMRLDALELTGATVHWRDAAVDPPVDLSVRVDAGADDIVLGQDAAPLDFRVSVEAPGLIDRLSVDGSATLGQEQQQLAAALGLTGLRADALSGYLPPELEVSLRDGRLAARLEMEHARLPGEEGRGSTAGGALRLEVSELSFRDGEEADAFLAMERFSVDAPRLDPAGGVLHLEAVELVGLEVAGELRPDGGLSLFGVALPALGAGADGVSEVEGAAPVETASAGDDGATAGVTSGEPAPVATPVAAPVAAPEARGPLAPPPPELRLDRLDLEVARLVLRRPEGVELGVTDLRLRNVEPVVLLGEESEAQPPTKLTLEAAIAPRAGEVSLALDLHPFATEPRVGVELQLSALRGDGLMELAQVAVPELPELVDMSALQDGSFRASLEVVAHVRRRSGADLAWDEGFGAEVVLREVALRQAPEGAPQLGLEGLSVDIARFDPGGGELRVRSVEVETPIAHLTRRADGVAVAGVLVKLPAAPEDSGAEDGTAAEGEAAAGGAELAADEPAAAVGGVAEGAAEPAVAAPAAEIRVDELLISGLDVLIVDETTDPVFVLPLRELEVEARALTTRSLSEPLPVRSTTLLGIGAPEDPGATVGEIAFFTDLVLFPTLGGGVKLDVSALEVLPFRGPAAAAGVGLGGGVVDVTATVHFPGDGGAEVDASIQLTDLDVSEDEGGPLESLLALPAPLDAVLFVLRDDQGTIEIPLAFDVDEEGPSLVAISTAGVSALSSLIVSAVAASPLRMASALGDLTGLFGEEEPLDLEPLLVDFEPASPGVIPGDAPVDEQLGALRERLLDDGRLVVTLRHEFGLADVESVARRANPSEEVCLALLAELRARKSTLLDERARAEESAYSALLTRGSAFAADEVRRLREAERKLGETERALDEILEILRPGADRKRRTRTKGAALELAALRLREVRDLILGAEVEELAERVRVVRARFREPSLPEGGRVRAELSAKRAR